MPSRRLIIPPLPKGTGIVFAGTLVNMLAVGASLPILPRYVKGPLGSGDVEVGLVFGAFAFAAIAARPVAGRFGDRRGRRQVIVAGTAMTAVAGALYALPAGVPGLVLARVLLGAGEGIVYTSGAAWVADRSPEETRGRLIGLFGLAIWSGMSIGPVLGQVTFDLTGSFGAVWALCALMPLGALATVVRMPDDAVSATAAGADGDAPHGIRSLLPRAAIRPGVALMVANLGFAAFTSFLVLLLDERGIGHGALAFACFAVAVVVNRFLFGDLPDILGGRRGAMIAASTEAVGLLMLSVADSLPVALVATVVMGSGFSILFPSLALLVLDRADPKVRGAAMGTFTAFFDLGIAFGSPIAGLAASAFGYPAAFVAGAAGAAISLVLLPFNDRSQRR